MKKIIRKNLKVVVSFVIGIVVFGCVGIYAAMVTADQIMYKDMTVKTAIDQLYVRTSNLTKFCKLVDGNLGEISSKYECDPGDGVIRNFYLLANNSNNSVELIMDRNITQGTSQTTMSWYDAMEYFTIGTGKSIKESWINVLDINLPSAQDIANAVGRSDWQAARNNPWWCLETKKKDTPSSPYCYNTTTNTLWIWDYTRECKDWKCGNSLATTEAYGYWTRDLVTANMQYAWDVYGVGMLNDSTVSNTTKNGVRPVITVLRSNLYAE